MTSPSELVTDPAAYSFLKGECDKVIDTSNRLPDFVFKRSFAKYHAIEYSCVTRKKFGSFLFKLANIFGDETVNYVLIDPDPVECYYRESSYFGMASFKRLDVENKYHEVMDRDENPSVVESFLVNAHLGAFWGSSLKWGIFCDRISWELAVIAVAEEVDVAAMGGFQCLDPVELADYMKDQYQFTNPATAVDFSQRFLANYPI